MQGKTLYFIIVVSVVEQNIVTESSNINYFEILFVFLLYGNNVKVYLRSEQRK